MTKIKTDDNRVDATFDGKFHAFWHEQVVFENGRVKRFETEARLGNFSPAAIWRERSFIELIWPQLAASLDNSDYRRDVGYPHLTDMATRLANVRFRVKRTSRR